MKVVVFMQKIICGTVADIKEENHFNVSNGSKITSMISQFYDSIELADIHSPIRVAKMSVFSEYCINLGTTGSYDDDFIDMDCAADFEFASFLVDCFLADNFYIMPASVLADNDFRTGMTLEWIPSKAVYITSKSDYLKLYESFSEYLQTTQQVCEERYGFKVREDMELIICFSSLYESADAVFVGSEDEHTLNPLFTAENFRPHKTKVTTLNSVFEL